MSFPRADFVALLAQLTKRERYLELGLGGGLHLSIVANSVSEAKGVCLSSVHHKLPSNCRTFQMTTDQYFTQTKYNPDFIFIDADHHYEQVKQDLENTLRIMTDDAIILLHDTDPQSKELMDQTACGDAYKIINDLSNYGLSHVTLPLEEAGMTIASKHRRVLYFI